MSETTKRDLQWIGTGILVALMWTIPGWLILLGLA